MNRRTTVGADEHDLAVLADEARRRGISLGRMLGEAVAKEARELRRSKRPQVATFHADASIAVDAEREEPAARPFRS
jgi:hypothetical protein